ncbi:hypothetical protein COY25_00305 [Candidatus Uhrbacteria bacterium CG_4_10_14_0_2_um_filter_41_7]|uniref:Gcp-like domain-containing protein n=1 Tax=Candidatus Uhrbacteria bacterium CG_4_9_14_3_um_filter_41_35 TaxID=1975034 RepID=A0A2M7XFL6_9BACT|nr:MAG: hypothetical protein COV92_01820 [Candidatus Uhrbacteria bacterium CG11_big_fil_rev_8_21_14_0_20_41_9]PIZ55752.1 MAG: hypothetical protein COY25_00305 [Candidatus Uhrbacteria bacterium CG_4_10_14_0_2_um_filter_41_7]PJA46652.1 MAG: hypothetical protein CO173_02695 [Candidatus Uhrbacteria bacterium CG_4_9_14_3_um_filter_41_35]
MRLYLNGSDLEQLVLADLDSEKSLIVVKTPPEGYLKEIDAYLKDFDVLPASLEGIYVVTGPGSATALRTLLSIVNTIKFAFNTKVYSVQKNLDEQDSVTIKNLLNKNFDQHADEAFAEPVYESSPRITVSKKDNLGR